MAIKAPDLVDPSELVEYQGSVYLEGYAPHRYGGMSGYFKLQGDEFVTFSETWSMRIPRGEGKTLMPFIKRGDVEISGWYYCPAPTGSGRCWHYEASEQLSKKLGEL